MEKKKLLIVDDDPRRRLVVVSVLSRRFDVFPLPGGEDPLRAARSRRPDLVLFALDKRNVDDVLRYCRTLRTDVRPIDRVAVYTTGRPVRTTEIVCDLWRADGHLAGVIDGARIDAFVDALMRGERPVSLPPDGGVFGRVLDRLRG